MKLVKATIVFVMMASGAQAAGVSDYGAQVRRAAPACALQMAGPFKAAFQPGAAAPCCDGHVQCSQMLATTTIERRRGQSHT